MPKLRELLADVVPRDLLDLVPSSFDIIGSRLGAVAIVEIPKELEEYKHEIAKAIVRQCKHVKTVLRKVGARRGEYRLYNFEVLIPGPTEVLHKEHGYYIKVDPTKAYFSPRDQNDRIEIAKMVRPGEVVLYLFAGVGPYAIAIAKIQPNVGKIIAVELNPNAYNYLVENIRLNKLEDKVEAILGDVREVCRNFHGVGDRVLMTLPLGAYQYLDLAIPCVKREGGVVHFYHIGPEERPFEEAERLVMESCAKLGYQCEVLGRRVVRDYAPRVYKVRIDFAARLP